ncbi:P-loop containing nucleoside triphosphate hydrolase protein [Cylindrobasidium torrendii FP15055 ss-10]|uniref:RNA helicase n=1 Tax=Cylindrobasidium torrendii FP15055 ss-10 TaxID=1314674 RepID=A0A0D7BKI8_9AGAR|nr:P-loop containing nucleoside triphosphate hydrolase protein [Cylindrobasidium torrendii FP15055 ss-10]
MSLFRTTTFASRRCIPRWRGRPISIQHGQDWAPIFNAEEIEPPAGPKTFEDIGLRSSVVKAARSAFPSLELPTETQCRLIPAINEGKDVILADDTGSGKSLGIVLGLLNKPRLRFNDKKTGKPRKSLSITSLLLVPHRDLANQLFLWIQRMSQSSQTTPAKISSIAQVLTRDDAKQTQAMIDDLRADPPHILIATPQVLLDVIKKAPDAIPLHEISTVVLDEIDYLVEAVTRYDKPTFKQKLDMKKQQKKLDKHPSASTLLLDSIYQREDAVERTDKPQLIVSSATLRRSLNRHLLYDSGWMENSENTVFLRGEKFSSSTALNRGLGGGDVHHSVVVVRGDECVNIEEALPGPKGAPVVEHADTEDAVEIDSTDEARRKYHMTPSPFDQQVFEAISVAFALDVPSVALLVLDASAPVQRAVHDLQSLGVNAVQLDVADTDRGRTHLLNHGRDATAFRTNPVLLVCNRATFRGLDLPELTHVFITGLFKDQMNGAVVDEYLQIAGRVGRFGRGGKVVTFIKENDVTAKEGLDSSARQVKTALYTLKDVGVKPVRFEHFD